MQKTFTILLAIVCMTVAGAQAQSFTLDVTDGSEFFLVNKTMAPIDIYGYEIYLPTSDLYPEGWNSIASQAAGPGFADLAAHLGVTVAGFGEHCSISWNLTEVNQPGVTWPAGYRLSIGQACLPRADLTGMEFKYATKVDGAWTTLEGDIIPEPATCTVFGLGVAVVIRRRRA